MFLLLQTVLGMVNECDQPQSLRYLIKVTENLHSHIWVKQILDGYNQNCAFNLNMLQVTAQSCPLEEYCFQFPFLVAVGNFSSAWKDIMSWAPSKQITSSMSAALPNLVLQSTIQFLIRILLMMLCLKILSCPPEAFQFYLGSFLFSNQSFVEWFAFCRICLDTTFW